MRKIIAFVVLFCSLGFSLQLSAQIQNKVNPFLVAGGQNSTPVLISAKDAKVVSIAADLFAGDVQSITGQKPEVLTKLSETTESLIIAGTLGSNKWIDQLLADKRVNVTAIDQHWESWLMQVVDDPFPGIKQALVIVGSDRRATAYGILELSKMMGVSAWEWWADVQTKKQDQIILQIENKTFGSPSVKYRGLFINDEDWGLQPWAAKTFEPETGDIGPKTYAKIFELMLRLRANTLWPAMHGCTKAFYTIAGNAQVADDYAIVVGTSHCEPMLCNINAEWKGETMGEWRYDKNAQTIRDLFEERTQNTIDFESIYTIGMRGEHDSPMNATELTKDDQIKLLEKVINDQRTILENESGKDAQNIPQVFIPYKEVLDYYQNGLQVPEDVTFMWTDDNYGYIRQLSNAQEQKRPGGGGIYYHASYWGRPHDYLWLSSANPTLIWEEMYKAYQFNAREMWILNCGDIKPLEYNISLFMDMAWDINAFPKTSAVQEHLKSWLGNVFGAEKQDELTELMLEYYHLCFIRRPEFMAWSQTEPITKARESEFSQIRYNDELDQFLGAWEKLQNKVKQLEPFIDSEQQEAFLELVYYPVVGASLLNQKWLYYYKNKQTATQGRSSAGYFAEQSKLAYEQIKQETDDFNSKIQNGKWLHIMSLQPRNLPVFSLPDFSYPVQQEKTELGIALEGYEMEVNHLIDNNHADVLPVLNAYLNDSAFVDLFLKGDGSLEWKAVPQAPWIQLSETHGKLINENGSCEQRLWVSIDWEKVPRGKNSKEPPLGHDYQLIPPAYKVNSSIDFVSADTVISIGVSVFNPEFEELETYDGFIEGNGYVSINAENFTAQEKSDKNSWEVLNGIGYTGSVVAAMPYQSVPVDKIASIKTNSPSLEYDFYTFNFGMANVRLQAIPTHPYHEGSGVRCAVAIDDNEPVIIDFVTHGRSEEWKQNVLKNAAYKSASQLINEPGKHKLKIWMVDPGLMLDRILIDLGGWKGSYTFPVETYCDSE